MKAENDLVGFVNLTHSHDTLTRRLRQSFKAARHLANLQSSGSPRGVVSRTVCPLSAKRGGRAKGGALLAELNPGPGRPKKSSQAERIYSQTKEQAKTTFIMCFVIVW